MNDITYIDDQKAFETYCAQINNADKLFMDTEFIRRNTWRARLSLMQICDGEKIILVDVLGLKDPSAIDKLFANQQINWVMHAPEQDLEVINHYCGIQPNSIYDTQLAAAFVGFDLGTSYKDLVASVLGETVNKSSQQSDWLRRPLRAAQLNYAAADVRHLPALWSELEQSLHELGRWQWYLEEMKTMHCAWCDTSVQEPTDIYSAMFQWREEEAKNLDIPANWVVKKNILNRIIELRSPTVEVIDKLLKKSFKAHVSAEQLHKILLDYKEMFPGRADRGSHPPIPKEQLEYVRDAVAGIARDHNISPTLLAGRKYWGKLIEHPEQVSLGWRLNLLTPLLERLKASASPNG